LFLSRLGHDVGMPESMEHPELGCKGKQMCLILEWNLGKLTANILVNMVKSMPVHTMMAHEGGA